MEPIDEAALDRMVAAKEQLRRDKAAAEVSIDEAFARRRRLAKQEELLERRFHEAVRRGLQNIDELEKLEKEEEEEEARARQENAAGSSFSPRPTAPVTGREDSLDPTQVFSQADLAALDQLSPSWFGDIGQSSTQPQPSPP